MKLRISHLAITPVLVWDDGEELTPGPELGQINVPYSQLSIFAETLPAEVQNVAKKLTQ